MDSAQGKIKEFLRPFLKELASLPCWIQQLNIEDASEFMWRHPGKPLPTCNDVVDTNGACLVVPRPNTPVYPRTITNADHAETVRARLRVVIAQARCWDSKVPGAQLYSLSVGNMYDLKPDVQWAMKLHIQKREGLLLQEQDGDEESFQRPMKPVFFNSTLERRLELIEAKQNLRCNRYGTDVAEDMFIGIDTPIETRQLEVDRIRANLRGDAHGAYMCDDKDDFLSVPTGLEEDLGEALKAEKRAAWGLSTPDSEQDDTPAESPIRPVRRLRALAPKPAEGQLSGGEPHASDSSMPGLNNSDEGMTTSDDGPGDPPPKSVAKASSRAKSKKRKRSAAEIADDEPPRRSLRVAEKTNKAKG